MVGVPEGDTIFRAAAQLRAALVGKELVELEVRRDPRGRRGPEPGTAITAVDSAGKHLLVHFADGHVLHTHMQMMGAWHIYRPAERWRRPGHSARVVVRVDDGTTAVCFSAPIVELRRERDARDRPSRASRMLDRIGPDLCEPGVDLDAVLARLALLDPETELATALLDQRVAAGIGNVFKSEICWAERIFSVHGHRRARRADAAGHLRDRAAPTHQQPDDRAPHDLRQRARGLSENRTALPTLRHEHPEPARSGRALDLLVPPLPTRREDGGRWRGSLFG
jgi:formamidopyrimidine-DNA glycosylase